MMTNDFMKLPDEIQEARLRWHNLDTNPGALDGMSEQDMARRVFGSYITMVHKRGVNHNDPVFTAFGDHNGSKIAAVLVGDGVRWKYDDNSRLDAGRIIGKTLYRSRLFDSLPLVFMCSEIRWIETNDPNDPRMGNDLEGQPDVNEGAAMIAIAPDGEGGMFSLVKFIIGEHDELLDVDPVNTQGAEPSEASSVIMQAIHLGYRSAQAAAQ